MLKTKFYNRKTKRMEWKAELTRGESYDLIKRNIASLETLRIEDITAKEWEQTFANTVSFADNNGVELKDSEGHAFDLDELNL